jgi:hypothetical protein
MSVDIINQLVGALVGATTAILVANLVRMYRESSDTDI